MNLIKNFQQICQRANIDFLYGNQAWQNLKGAPVVTAASSSEPSRAKRHLFLHPIERRAVVNEYGAILRYMIYCKLFYGVRSSLDDPTYQFKFDEHIGPLYNEFSALLNDFNYCSGLKVENLFEREAQQYLDANFDGLFIELELRKNV